MSQNVFKYSIFYYINLRRVLVAVSILEIATKLEVFVKK